MRVKKFLSFVFLFVIFPLSLRVAKRDGVEQRLRVEVQLGFNGFVYEESFSFFGRKCIFSILW